MIGYVYYYSEPKHHIPSIYDSLIKSAASWGNLVGQLYFGYLADKHGRKKMYDIEVISLKFIKKSLNLIAHNHDYCDNFMRFIL